MVEMEKVGRGDSSAGEEGESTGKPEPGKPERPLGSGEEG